MQFFVVFHNNMQLKCLLHVNDIIAVMA